MSKQIKISDKAYSLLKRVEGNTSAEKIMFLFGFWNGKLSVTNKSVRHEDRSNQLETQCKKYCIPCEKGKHYSCVNKDNCECEL